MSFKKIKLSSDILNQTKDTIQLRRGTLLDDKLLNQLSELLGEDFIVKLVDGHLTLQVLDDVRERRIELKKRMELENQTAVSKSVQELIPLVDHQKWMDGMSNIAKSFIISTPIHCRRLTAKKNVLQTHVKDFWYGEWKSIRGFTQVVCFEKKDKIQLLFSL